MTARAERAAEIFDELLDDAYLRVQKATREGNPEAIDAAKGAYYELLEDIMRAEQQAARADEQTTSEASR